MRRTPHDPVPLVFDLARDIHSPRWWRALGTMLAGLAVLVWAAAVLAPPPTAPGAPLSAHAAPDVAAAPHAHPGDDGSTAARSGHRTTGGTAEADARDAPATADPATAESAVKSGTMAAVRTRHLVLHRGERLIDLLRRAGLDRRAAHRWAAAVASATDARRLRAGLRFDLEFSSAPSSERETQGPATALRRLAFKPGIDRRIEVVAGDAGSPLSVATRRVPLARVWGHAQGRITESLYVDAAREGVPAAVLVRLMRVLGFVVDFEREIWPGDRFEILYSRPIAEDGETGEGEPVHVALTLRGRRIAFTRFVDPRDGRVDFYDDEGRSVRRTLMKTPLDGARITSRFGRRRHPILGYVRAHRGLDFGAPAGTPVYAAGDGTIVRAGRYGSYGNYVRIRHGSGYETAYAHLSRITRGIRKGARVRQGQIIGRVGATGRATGPHLHYEVLVDGRQVDPLRLKLPSGRRLAGESLTRFRKWRAEVEAMRSELARTRALLVAARRTDAESAAGTADAASAAGRAAARLDGDGR